MGRSNKGDVLRIQCDLPEDLAQPFLEECEKQDRDMASMTRIIIRTHFEQLKQQQELDEFRRLRKLQSEKPPHFSGETPVQEQGATG